MSLTSGNSNSIMKQIIALILSAFIAPLVFSQTPDSVFISGQIVAKDWCPLPGVNVQIVDSNYGTISDLNGRFKSKVPRESVLSFSMISEPYYLSLCNVLKKPDTDTIDCVFRLDDKNGYKCKKPAKAPTIIKLNSNNRGSHIFNLVACYNKNIEKITLAYYNKYKESEKEIGFIVNGELIDKPNLIDSLNFKDFASVLIIKTTPDKYLFITATYKKP